MGAGNINSKILVNIPIRGHRYKCHENENHGWIVMDAQDRALVVVRNPSGLNCSISELDAMEIQRIWISGIGGMSSKKYTTGV